MTSLKSILTLLLAMAVAVSCDEEKITKKTGKLELSFSDVTSSSGGRLKGNIATVLVTIRGADGQLIHDRKAIELFKFANEYLSEPIALTTGNYSLSEFIVLDETGTALYATPLEGSPLAHLVDDPLPVDFSITKDDVTKVAPQVIKIEGNSAVDFGYATFTFDIVETFSFNVGVLVYNAAVKNFELTNAHIKVASGAEILFDKDMTAITNAVRIRDGFQTYRVTITKTGYSPFEETFTVTQLKAYGTGTPLVVTLLMESLSNGLIAHYPFNGNANDQTPNNLDGTVHGAVLTTDKDGHAQAAYSFDGVDDYISVADNDLLDLSNFSISLWANIAATQQPHEGINDILRKWNGDAAGYPFSISYLNPLADDAFEDKIIYARYDGQGCGNIANTYSPNITNDTFVHIVMVKDGNKIRTYLNNVFAGEITDPTTCSIANDADMTIGSRGNLVRFFKGKIDDIRIYGRALSETEIGNLNGE